MKMSAAEFVCQRELLGLSIVWLAENLGVTKRTIYRWENGTHPIPDWAADRIRLYVKNTQDVIGKVAVQVMKDPSIPFLTTYREDWGTEMPASWHRLVMARVAERTGHRIEWASDVEEMAK